MSNGRKAKGGTSIFKRLAGGNGDKTKAQERRMPRGNDTPTERGKYVHRRKEVEPETFGRSAMKSPRERATYLNPAPKRGRHERYRQYEHKTKLRENKPKVESEKHREKVEEHKRKHPHKLEEGEHWVL